MSKFVYEQMDDHGVSNHDIWNIFASPTELVSAVIDRERDCGRLDWSFDLLPGLLDEVNLVRGKSDVHAQYDAVLSTPLVVNNEPISPDDFYTRLLSDPLMKRLSSSLTLNPRLESAVTYLIKMARVTFAEYLSVKGRCNVSCTEFEYVVAYIWDFINHQNISAVMIMVSGERVEPCDVNQWDTPVDGDEYV